MSQSGTHETAIPPGRFSGLLLKVNAFLLIALALVSAFAALVAYKQGWLIRYATIHFVTVNALGINKGMPVKLYGFTVGSVKDMELGKNAVDVELAIVAEHLQRIPKDSHARLVRESGVVGASVIDIVPGKLGEPLAENGRIEFDTSRGIAEIIDDLRRQLTPTLNELRQTLGQINRSGADISVTLQTLRSGIEGLPDTHRAVRKLIDDTDRTAREATTSLVAARQATDSVRRAADAVPALAGKLSTTLESIDAAAVQFRRTAEDAQDTLRRTRPVLERGESAARDAAEVMSAAKRTWPLSGAFAEPADAALPIDSFEARSAASRP